MREPQAGWRASFGMHHDRGCQSRVWMLLPATKPRKTLSLWNHEHIQLGRCPVFTACTQLPLQSHLKPLRSVEVTITRLSSPAAAIHTLTKRHAGGALTIETSPGRACREARNFKARDKQHPNLTCSSQPGVSTVNNTHPPPPHPPSTSPRPSDLAWFIFSRGALPKHTIPGLSPHTLTQRVC